MTPKKIALLTDSSADLRWETAEENNIFFVPLRILCRDGEYLDGVDIRGTDVYQRLHAGGLPQTSLPRVEDFAAKLHEIFEKGYDGVIAVMLPSGLSGTYNLARLVAEECKEQGRAMAAIEYIPKTGFYDYKNKYQAGLTEEICPAPISAEDTERVQRLAERVYEALHLDTYGRADFLMDKADGELYCLEANTLPGMTPTSLIPQMAAAEGMDYGELCEKIIEVSLKKYKK